MLIVYSSWILLEMVGKYCYLDGIWMQIQGSEMHRKSLMSTCHVDCEAILVEMKSSYINYM